MTPAAYERLTGQKLPPLASALPTGAKPTKYRSRRVQGVGGLWFDSKKEAARAQELTRMQAAGLITELELDKRRLRYALVVNGVKVGTYVADARYHDLQGHLIVEDVKGYKTRSYLMKKKLMKSLYNIEIQET